MIQVIWCKFSHAVVVSLLFFLPIEVWSQWRVSDDVQPKNVLMEEFTGTGCYWCPDGHAVADRMAHVWPGRVFPMNIHTGSLAKAYTTTEGNQIGQYFDCESAGYPSGDVNRCDFGSGFLMSRSLWQEAAATVLAEAAPVNLLLQGQYDASSGQLSVYVEGVFTSEVVADQRLCVLLLQDNVWGYQNGSTSGSYCHRHILRKALTDVWGDPIEEVAVGSHFSRDFSLLLPDRIGDVDVKPEDLQLVAYVSAGRTDIEQVLGVKPECKGVDIPLSVRLEQPRITIGTHYGYHFFEVLLENECNQHLSSATFELTVGQQTEVQTVDCDIDGYGFQYLRLPMSYEYSKRGTTTYSITLTAVNGITLERQSLSGQFVKPNAVTQNVQVKLQTDSRAWQNVFAIRDAEGQLVCELGTFSTNEPLLIEQTLQLAPATTYCLEVTDSWGNGMLSDVQGYCELRDETGVLIENNYVYDYGTRIFFITEATDGITTPTLPSVNAPANFFHPDGQPMKAPQRGLNIVKRRGTSEKLYIK